MWKKLKQAASWAWANKAKIIEAAKAIYEALKRRGRQS